MHFVLAQLLYLQPAEQEKHMGLALYDTAFI